MCTTKQNDHVALCSKGGEIRETKTRISNHETLNIATKPTLNPDRKTTGATIGYNVITCSQ